MSARTVIPTVAARGLTARTLTPSHWLKASLAIMAPTIRSASSWSRSSSAICEATAVFDQPSHEGAGPITILAILLLQIGHRPKYPVEAELIPPREKPFWVVHSLCHGEVDVGGSRHAPVHRVDGLVYEHREDAIDDLLAS